MTAAPDPLALLAADELALLADNAADAGLPWSGPPPVRRQAVQLGSDREVSALVWGEGPPEAVLLHGRAQNAHTWDTVALALLASGPGRSFVAVDLPGHGRSGWRGDHDYSPAALAEDLRPALAELAPAARLLVGMSLGGLASLALLGAGAGALRSLVLVDITPGVGAPGERPAVAFTAGPDRFASFADILSHTAANSPGRRHASLRRGVFHNARQLPDGSWAWRWDPARAGRQLDRDALWGTLAELDAAVTLVRGGSSRVVTEADLAELARRRPDAEVVVVEGAGHSVQGDRPVAVAGILSDRWPPAGGRSRP